MNTELNKLTLTKNSNEERSEPKMSEEILVALIDAAGVILDALDN